MVILIGLDLYSLGGSTRIRRQIDWRKGIENRWRRVGLETGVRQIRSEQTIGLLKENFGNFFKKLLPEWKKWQRR